MGGLCTSEKDNDTILSKSNIQSNNSSKILSEKLELEVIFNDVKIFTLVDDIKTGNFDAIVVVQDPDLQGNNIFTQSILKVAGDKVNNQLRQIKQEYLREKNDYNIFAQDINFDNVQNNNNIQNNGNTLLNSGNNNNNNGASSSNRSSNRRVKKKQTSFLNNQQNSSTSYVYFSQKSRLKSMNNVSLIIDYNNLNNQNTQTNEDNSNLLVSQDNNSKENKKLCFQVTTVLDTEAGELPTQHLIHGILPDYDVEDEEEKMEILYSTILNCLEKANNLGVQNLAFPFFKGKYLKIREEDTSCIMWFAIKYYLEQKSSQDVSLKNIYIIPQYKEQLFLLKQDYQAIFEGRKSRSYQQLNYELEMNKMQRLSEKIQNKYQQGKYQEDYQVNHQSSQEHQSGTFSNSQMYYLQDM